MKRLLCEAQGLDRENQEQLLAGLSCAQLHALRRELDTRYNARATAVYAAFFDQSDAFFALILEPLARTEPIAFVGTLATVSRQWCALVLRITHCVLPRNDWDGWDYKELLEQYTRITSIQSHPKILYETDVAHFGEITSLELTYVSAYDTDGYAMDASAWTSLTSLQFGACRDTILGLETLTQLTRLDISPQALETVDTLSRLTQLRHLSLYPRDLLAADELDLAPLVALRYLESYAALHFARYTGAGLLETYGPRSDVEQRVRDTYFPGCSPLRCEGEWRQGLFTGHVNAVWPPWSCYDGGMRDHRRHGPAVWCEGTTRRFEGEWLHGALHGRTDCYLLEALDPQAGGTRKRRLCATEQWEHGRLVERAEYGDVNVYWPYSINAFKDQQLALAPKRVVCEGDLCGGDARERDMQPVVLGAAEEAKVVCAQHRQQLRVQRLVEWEVDRRLHQHVGHHLGRPANLRVQLRRLEAGVLGEAHFAEHGQDAGHDGRVFLLVRRLVLADDRVDEVAALCLWLFHGAQNSPPT